MIPTPKKTKRSSTRNDLPKWIVPCLETVKADRAPIRDSYLEGCGAGKFVLETEDNWKVKHADHHLARMVDEVIAGCLSNLDRPPVTELRCAGINEYHIWLGSIPHELAYGLGRRVRCACQIFERRGAKGLVSDFDETIDNTLPDFQGMMTALTLLGRRESRIGEGHLIYRKMVSDTLSILLGIANMVRLAGFASSLEKFDQAISKLHAPA